MPSRRSPRVPGSPSWKAIADRVPVGLVVWRAEEPNGELRLVEANEAACLITRSKLREAIGKTLEEIIPGADREVVERIRQVALTGTPADIGDVGSALNRGVVLSVRAVAIEDRSVAVLLEDVTSMRLVQKDVERVSSELRDLYDHAAIAQHSLDANGVYVRVNDTEATWLGYPRRELLRRRFAELLTPESRERFERSFQGFLASGSVRDVELDVVRKDGSIRSVVVYATAVRDAAGAFVMSRSTMLDITDRKRAEDELRRLHAEIEQRVEERTRELVAESESRRRAEAELAHAESQLRQAQKMDALGRLAGGVAHDFNNMLSAIIGFTEVAQSDAPEGTAVRSDLEQVRLAAERAAALTRQLLSFSRQQPVSFQPVDVAEVVRSIEPMLHRLLGAHVQLIMRHEPGAWASGDRGLIEQVVLNLALNARDAMPDGGVLTIETATVDVGESEAAGDANTAPGKYVVLSVSDTGAGMDDATLARIFEPFFTTKPRGIGTGLGLATVYGIVRQCRGRVSVESAPGRGTRFLVRLPRVDAPVRRAEPLHRSPPGRGRGETIVVVEDELLVRKTAQRILTAHGYRVVTCEPEEALERVRSGAAIDLLLSDVVMPGMSGPTLARAIRALRPAVPIVLMSGYADSDVVPFGAIPEGMPFVQKPLRAELLANAVREELDRAAPPNE